MPDYYKILGVEKTASADDIKRAFRRLASIYHPDREGGDTEKFQQIQEAYAVLSDSQKRAEYDSPQSRFGEFNFNFNNFPFQDIFQQFHRQQQPHTVYRTSISITLEEVLHGTQHTINLQTRTGNTVARVNCPPGIEHGQQIKYDNILDNASLIVTWFILPHLLYTRNGSDIITTSKINVLELIVGKYIRVKGLDLREFEINVPARTQPGTILRIPGQGLPVLNTNHRGDLRIEVQGYIPVSIPQTVIQAITEMEK